MHEALGSVSSTAKKEKAAAWGYGRSPPGQFQNSTGGGKMLTLSLAFLNLDQG